MYTKKQFREDLFDLIAICNEELKICKDEWLIDFIKDCVIPETYYIIWQIKLKQVPPKGQRWFQAVARLVDNSDPWENSKTLESKMLFISNIYRHELED